MPDRYVRQSDLVVRRQSDRADWKTVAMAEETGELVVPQGSIGYRWPKEGEAKGRWNLEAKDGETGEDVAARAEFIDRRDEVVSGRFPLFRRQAA